jgi:2-(1,2-epoxy-1,2-dihydrophenyl)acetyl-CoA isomerase
VAVVSYREQNLVAVVTLERPEALNSFDRALRLELAAALERAAGAPARAVVLTAAGRGFSAGADLKDVRPEGTDVEQILLTEFAPGIRAMVTMPKPVIAAVHGFASGIGAAYVLAADLVVMGESAFLHIPFARIGLLPDGGLCWHLARQLGHQRAFELAADGERLPAERARELGLANKVVADGTVEQEALAWAARLAGQAPLALARTKAALRAATTLPLTDTIALEARLQKECAASADFAEGIAAFFAKRPGQFTGR